MQKDEFEDMIVKIRQTEKLLGKVDYSLTQKRKSRRVFSRSLYVSKDIKKDEIFTKDNIRSVRPGYGLHPKYLKDILGKKANKDLSFATALSLKDIEK